MGIPFFTVRASWVGTSARYLDDPQLDAMLSVDKKATPPWVLISKLQAPAQLPGFSTVLFPRSPSLSIYLSPIHPSNHPSIHPSIGA